MRYLLTLDPAWHFRAGEYDIIKSAIARFPTMISDQEKEAADLGEMIDAEETSGDGRLIKAVLSGDDEAFTELVRRHKRKIFSIVAKFARNEDELDDISQEIFVKMYQGLHKYRGEAPLEHWLSKLAVNACYDMLRKRQRDADKVPLETVEFSLSSPETQERRSSEAWDILRRAMTGLRPEDRLVITLLNLEEKSVREVSALTGWSEAKVKVRAFRARKELKKILEDSDEGRSERR